LSEPFDPPSPPEEKALHKSGASAAIVMVGTALSRVLGYVRIFVFAYVFGSTGLADVLTAVIRIPESLRNLFAEGALSSAFIPTLSTALVEDPSGERARRIVSNLFTFVVLLLIPLCTLGVIFNKQVVSALVHFNDTKLYLAASADGTRLAGAADDGAFHFSADGGLTWTDWRSEHKWSAFALAADGTHAAGVVKNGSLYLSADNGRTWQTVKAAGERPWSAIGLARHGALVVAGAEDGYLGVTRDSGLTWTVISPESWRSWSAAAMSASGEAIVAAYENGGIRLSRDGGATWTDQPGDEAWRWLSLALAADGADVFAAGNDGWLYRSTDGAKTWTRLPAAGKNTWSSVSLAADGNKLLAAVSEGSYFLSADGGATWTRKEGAGVYRWKMLLTEKLFPYDVWFLLFISLSAVLMGALNAKHKFVIPALTPILFSVTVIASVLWLPLPLEYRMIAGIVAGGVVQVLFQIPSFLRARYRLVPDFRLNHADFRQILIQWLPVVASASIFIINTNIAGAFASTLEPGSVTALYNAGIFFQLPLGIFSTSVITVLFPRLSRQAAQGLTEDLKDTLRYGLRFMLVLLVPSTLLLVCLGQDVISLTLEHGAFTRAGTLQASSVLTAFALGLFPTGVVNLFQRVFYALKDYKRPLAVAGFILVVDVGLSFLLKETPLRAAGLALASSIAFAGGLVLFVVLTRKRLGPLGLRALLATGLKVVLANIPLAVVIAVYLIGVRPAVVESAFLIRLVVLLGTGLVAVAVTFGAYLLLKVDIVEDILKGRFKRKRRA
jgi:putative peptidoglycan lipid II flippase